MTISVSDGGTYKESEALWVSSGGQWIEVSTGPGAVVPSFSTLVTDVNSLMLGSSVTLTAEVDPKVPMPTGTIQFQRDGVAIGSPVPLDASGFAVLVDTPPTPGLTVYNALYSGDDLYMVSGTMASEVLVVDLAVSWDMSFGGGQPVVFEATNFPATGWAYAYDGPKLKITIPAGEAMFPGGWYTADVTGVIAAFWWPAAATPFLDAFVDSSALFMSWNNEVIGDTGDGYLMVFPIDTASYLYEEAGCVWMGGGTSSGYVSQGNVTIPWVAMSMLPPTPGAIPNSIWMIGLVMTFGSTQPSELIIDTSAISGHTSGAVSDVRGEPAASVNIANRMKIAENIRKVQMNIDVSYDSASAEEQARYDRMREIINLVGLLR